MTFFDANGNILEIGDFFKVSPIASYSSIIGKIVDLYPQEECAPGANIEVIACDFIHTGTIWHINTNWGVKIPPPSDEELCLYFFG
ncbi:Uncharacterised protein [uncultured archaeon]|nr:Uncharacterised protein [uncultured archaeon]